jgi:hypothetical protein
VAHPGEAKGTGRRAMQAIEGLARLAGSARTATA